jgi:predicted MFS family arabinose efflux permease
LHLPAYVADRGFDASVGVIALSMVGLGNLIGTWAAGQSAAYFPKQYTLAFIYFGRCIVFLCFLFVPVTPTLVILYSFILGLLWLSTVPLTSSLVATFFGPVWMTMLFGIVFFSHQIGSFLGVWMAGRAYDLTKSYDLMWWASIGLGLFAALVHLPIRQEPVARLRKPSMAAAE